MAILNNASNDTCIVLTLKTIDESPSWISYDLGVFVKTANELHELSSMRGIDGLYFENENVPEVLMICNALDSLVNGNIDQYSFEPMDEKDFCLEIERKKEPHEDLYRVRLFMNYPSVFVKQGIQTNVSKENLLDFSKELKTEYEDLMSQFKQK